MKNRFLGFFFYLIFSSVYAQGVAMFDIVGSIARGTEFVASKQYLRSANLNQKTNTELKKVALLNMLRQASSFSSVISWLPHTRNNFLRVCNSYLYPSARRRCRNKVNYLYDSNDILNPFYIAFINSRLPTDEGNRGKVDELYLTTHQEITNELDKIKKDASKGFFGRLYKLED